MQHTDKAIAEFEAWWQQQLGSSLFEDVKEQMRSVWLASREELVIELPPKISEHNAMDNGFVRPEAVEYDSAIDDCRDAIEAFGVRVKE